MTLPSARPRRYLVWATPALISYSSRTGETMPVTGSRSSVVGAGDSGVGPALPSGTNAATSRIEPPRSARQRGSTRIPTDIASGPSTSTAWSIGVSAPSSRTSANANGSSSGDLVGRGSATHVHAVTAPPGPTSTNSPIGSAVVGSYSSGGTITRPSLARAPTISASRSPVRNRPTIGPTERV